jgi:hypothetical protein
MKQYTMLSLALAILLGAFTVSPSKVGASSANLPPGIYSTTITGADIPAEFPPEASAILVGYWEIEFTDSGSFIVSKDGAPAVVGRYNSTPGRVVMRDLEGPLACTDAPGIATANYRWTLSGDQLLLTTGEDRCFGRNFVLTAHPLEKE